MRPMLHCVVLCVVLLGALCAFPVCASDTPAVAVAATTGAAVQGSSAPPVPQAAAAPLLPSVASADATGAVVAPTPATTAAVVAQGSGGEDGDRAPAVALGFSEDIVPPKPGKRVEAYLHWQQQRHDEQLQRLELELQTVGRERAECLKQLEAATGRASRLQEEVKDLQELLAAEDQEIQEMDGNLRQHRQLLTQRGRELHEAVFELGREATECERTNMRQEELTQHNSELERKLAEAQRNLTEIARSRSGKHPLTTWDWLLSDTAVAAAAMLALGTLGIWHLRFRSTTAKATLELNNVLFIERQLETRRSEELQQLQDQNATQTTELSKIKELLDTEQQTVQKLRKEIAKLQLCKEENRFLNQGLAEKRTEITDLQQKLEASREDVRQLIQRLEDHGKLKVEHVVLQQKLETCMALVERYRSHSSGNGSSAPVVPSQPPQKQETTKEATPKTAVKSEAKPNEKPEKQKEKQGPKEQGKAKAKGKKGDGTAQSVTAATPASPEPEGTNGITESSVSAEANITSASAEPGTAELTHEGEADVASAEQTVALTESPGDDFETDWSVLFEYVGTHRMEGSGTENSASEGEAMAWRANELEALSSGDELRAKRLNSGRRVRFQEPEQHSNWADCTEDEPPLANEEHPLTQENTSATQLETSEMQRFACIEAGLVFSLPPMTQWESSLTTLPSMTVFKWMPADEVIAQQVRLYVSLEDLPIDSEGNELSLSDYARVCFDSIKETPGTKVLQRGKRVVCGMPARTIRYVQPTEHDPSLQLYSHTVTVSIDHKAVSWQVVKPLLSADAEAVHIEQQWADAIVEHLSVTVTRE